MSDTSRIASNRHREIIETLKKNDIVKVEELSELLDVSPVTVRRDLDTLDRQGLLIRIHGGAKYLKTPISAEPERTFFEKGIANTSEKTRIARMGADLVKENEILFLNGGSTSLFFLEAIDKKVRVITNNAASIVCDKDPLVELLVLGGQYREQSRSFVGDLALNALKSIHSDTTILGTNGLSLDVGMTTSVLQECSINQAMIRNTRSRIIVLADYSKIGHVSNFVSAILDEIDIIITDDKASKASIDSLRSQAIEVYVV